MYRLLDAVPVQNRHGECPLWHDSEQRLWWTDIQACRLYRMDPATRAMQVTALPERLCSFAFLAGDDTRILAAFETGVGFFDPGSGVVEWIVRPEIGTGRRFNDGRVDRQGRFWVGTMVEKAAADPAGLFCLTRDLVLQPHVAGVRISNSICFSPDGGRLYFSDSPGQIIHSYALHPETGALSGREVFAAVAAGEPDGAAVDAEGCVWSARWGAGCVMRHAPDGREIGRIEVPVTQPSCVAFGGADLKTLFVTSANEGFEGDRKAGAVLVYEVDVAGLVEERFVGT